MFNQIGNFLHGMGDDTYRTIHDGCEGGFMNSTMMMGGGMIISIAVIGLIVYLIISNTNSKKQSNVILKTSTSIELLENEFAKGNITEEEFIRKREILKR